MWFVYWHHCILMETMFLKSIILFHLLFVAISILFTGIIALLCKQCWQTQYSPSGSSDNSDDGWTCVLLQWLCSSSSNTSSRCGSRPEARGAPPPKPRTATAGMLLVVPRRFGTHVEPGVWYMSSTWSLVGSLKLSTQARIQPLYPTPYRLKDSIRKLIFFFLFLQFPLYRVGQRFVLKLQ